MHKTQVMQEAFNRLPDYVVSTIERFKADYSYCNRTAWSDTLRNNTREQVIGYLNGLNDAHFISDAERRALYRYITF